MRWTALVAAGLLAVFGPLPALLWLAVCLAVHVARDPGRLLDVCYAAVFCGVGYIAG